MTGTVAPARYPLTELHKREVHATPGGGAAATGQTVCGKPMLAAELWQEVPWRDGNRLCPGCFPGEPAPKGWVQEPMM